ncbi:hypothetical protein PPYR_07761 [Photinus pyralis]|uniref:DDE Tnp4 domain-containing protein n=2 Tax=Photinus pyralis TaxID=7054 RepID=A0A5N4A4K7_PHOPY|nr:protein ALP1-like [Photinus pyralis]XP_031341458.1 protein ALP1-like [Photinus pyralis]XP_031344016.1 protein ALP1-like [Photinus pyralis]XP_031346905.1 protein ALP1-like [Photinus pyralis]XP_031357487.1 protein ALP1-like [Photinus pyralis]KAB0792274.1 hypothetical protein PPYR_14233 [Photinus pyralis]KAB0799881.1 hypothetical protein PPYR_07761 [Photinus pyralis]
MNKRKLICGLAISLFKQFLSELEIFVFEAIDIEDEEDPVPSKRRKLPIRIENYMERVIPNLSKQQFQMHFRINYVTYTKLLPIIANEIKKKDIVGRPLIDIDRQLLAVLWLLATPDSFRSVGERFNMGKSSLSVSFFRIIKALNNIAPKVIVWPTGEQVEAVKEKFSNLAGIDGVIGAVDGTFIPIKAPKDDPEVYICRKCHYAITLQGICNASLKFTDVFVGYPGSVSDTRIFRNSDIYNAVTENVMEYFPNGEFILGDKAYPCLSWCIPPYINSGNMNAAKRNFNLRVSQTRQSIERAFGLLFGRLRRLKFLDMNRQDLIPATVVACCVVHNLCIESEDLLVEEFINEGIQFVRGNLEREHNGRGNLFHENGTHKRDQLCQRLFDVMD